MVVWHHGKKYARKSAVSAGTDDRLRADKTASINQFIVIWQLKGWITPRQMTSHPDQLSFLAS